MKSLKLLFAGIAGFAMLTTQCTSPTQNAGNGSDVGNGMIVGILYQPDGKTPAKNAKVTLRKKNSLIDTSTMLGTSTAGILAKKLAAPDSATVTTNDGGKFGIDSVDTGTYVLEGMDGGNNLVLNDSVSVKNKDSTVTLPPDTLKPAGAVKGVINLSEGGDPRKVFVLAFGIDRFARVNADGSFKFDMLAEGKYDLRLISSLDNYGVLDTNDVAVTAAETTDVKTINLPFTGIPTPKNVSIDYDTLKQIVTLSWNRQDSSLVSGYYVYRRNVDSNTVFKQINTQPITDTLYRDSTGIQDQTYEYSVSAIDKNATEGTKSAGVSMKVVGAFEIVKTINITPISNSVSKAIKGSTSNSFYILSRYPDRCIFILDSAGAFIDSIGKGILGDPYDMVQDSSGNFYVADIQKKEIFKFKPDGTKLAEWNIGISVSVLSLWDDTLIVAGGNQAVHFYNLNGDSLGHSILVNENIKGLAKISQNIFLYGDKTISVYQENGSFIRSIFNTDLSSLQTYNGMGYLLSFEDSSLIFTMNKVLYMINDKGEILAKLSSVGTPSGLYFDDAKKQLWIADITGVVGVFHFFK